MPTGVFNFDSLSVTPMWATPGCEQRGGGEYREEENKQSWVRPTGKLLDGRLYKEMQARKLLITGSKMVQIRALGMSKYN